MAALIVLVVLALAWFFWPRLDALYWRYVRGEKPRFDVPPIGPPLAEELQRHSPKGQAELLRRYQSSGSDT